MKSIFSRREQYEKLVGTNIHHLKIKKLLTIDKRMKFEAECVCGKIFYPRCESVLRTSSSITKSCGCKRYDMVSEANKKNGQLFKEIMKNYKYAAKKRKLSFNLTSDQFKLLLEKECSYCGSKPIEHRVKKGKVGKRRDQYLIYNGIDRINNKIGYEISNCVSCCKICNISKSTLDKQSFLDWIYRVAKHNEFIADS